MDETWEAGNGEDDGSEGDTMVWSDYGGAVLQRGAQMGEEDMEEDEVSEESGVLQIGSQEMEVCIEEDNDDLGLGFQWNAGNGVIHCDVQLGEEGIEEEGDGDEESVRELRGENEVIQLGAQMGEEGIEEDDGREEGGRAQNDNEGVLKSDEEEMEHDGDEDDQELQMVKELLRKQQFTCAADVVGRLRQKGGFIRLGDTHGFIRLGDTHELFFRRNNFFVKNLETGVELSVCPLQPCSTDVSDGMCAPHFFMISNHPKVESRRLISLPEDVTSSVVAAAEMQIAAFKEDVWDKCGAESVEGKTLQLSTLRTWILKKSGREGFRVGSVTGKYHSSYRDNIQFLDKITGNSFFSCVNFPFCLHTGSELHRRKMYCHNCNKNQKQPKEPLKGPNNLAGTLRKRAIRLLMEMAVKGEEVNLRNRTQFHYMLKYLSKVRDRVHFCFADGEEVKAKIDEYGRLRMSVMGPKKNGHYWEYKSQCFSPECDVEPQIRKCPNKEVPVCAGHFLCKKHNVQKEKELLSEYMVNLKN